MKKKITPSKSDIPSKEQADKKGKSPASLSQESIRSTPISRMAALGGTGAKVGINYLKYYGKRVMVGSDDSTQEKHARKLDEENASTIYETFSKLREDRLNSPRC